MATFKNMNTTFTKATNTITKIGEARQNTVKDVIKLCIEDAKANKHNFTSKKTAIASYIKETLGDAKADNYYKRSLKVAKSILVDGYKLKTELLTLAQMEQLTAFNKNVVNALMSLDEDEYIEAVKDVIKSAKVTKSTKVFSRAVAKKVTK